MLLAAVLAVAALGGCSRSGSGDAADGQRSAAAAPAVSPEAAYGLAAGGSGVQVGQLMAANTVYVFFDPQCPHCASLWQASKPLLGKLKMVWVPVELMGAESGKLGAAILASPQPVEALERHESLVSQRAPLTAPPADEGARAKIAANTELFGKLGAESVPTLYFRHAKSGQYGSHSGTVSTEQLKAMVGL
ncbi:thiol:disulfide interchange protein [Caldimonas brevitalea]|uniref:Thiol:disulfide interchange protein n=1 Tax=Caldimonas brevitalea TaxID=413882 RepID=A0A0G3BLS9_9BURK|nr:thiol:disulfide interchange protein [Caldimonas brevitalea]